MILSTVIILLVVLLILALVTPLFSPFFRARKLTNLVKRKEGVYAAPVGDAEGESQAEPISIVIVEHDSAFRLEQILPKFLSQKYNAEFQVVVVIDENDSESEDVLKRLSNDPHLYYTKLPITSRYLSRKKLGITLGLRAAKYEWAIITDVHCAPTSDDWLTHFATHCTEDKKVVLGMTPYEDAAPVYCRFDHIRTMLYHLRSAFKGMAFSTNQSLVAIRKEEFFKRKGFSGNLEYTRAEFDFLVNKFAEEDNTALAVEPEAWLKQFNPKQERWRGRQLFTLDALKSLERRAQFKFWSYIDNDLIHIFNLLTIGIIALGVWHVLDASDEVVADQADLLPEGLAGYILIGSAILLWIISFVERCLVYRPVLKAFSSISPVKAILLEWTMTFRNIVLAIRYRFADKNDFITHKL